MKEKFKALHEKHQKWYPLSFFLGGIVFDLITLGPVDDTLTLISLYTFTVIALLLLCLEILKESSQKNFSDLVEKIWNYKTEAFHFLLGSVLSAFFFFYYQSASLQASFSFLFFWIILLTFNEFFPIGRGGMAFRFALCFFCLFALNILLLPILIGQVGALIYLLSLAVSILALYFIHQLLLRKLKKFFGPGAKSVLANNFRYPMLVVTLFFVVVYFAKVIPPVPVSTSYIGVFHDVKKENSEYVLSYDRSKWLFWQKGAQDFSYREGDKVFIFVQVYSPAKFEDRVFLKWMMYSDAQNKWVQTDRIPFSIRGGRKEGYRGYAYKENYQEGKWRVLVVTDDDRELGRIYFELTPDSGANIREFKQKIH